MKNFVIVILVATFCLGANFIEKPTGQDLFLRHVIETGAVSLSPSKNIIFAEDGQNVAVIYGRYNGNPVNMYSVFVAYSTNRGNTWINYGPLNTREARRVYPALDTDENWPDPSDLRIHFAWHEAVQISGSYDSSPAFYAKEASFPDGLITAAFRLPNSGYRDVWFPCIGVKDSFIIITATNNSTFLTTNDCYMWRSTDYGATWDTGRLFIPGPADKFGPHFRFGSDGYIFFLWTRQQESNPALYWPYYCESFDYGVTWTQPQLLWQNTPPYPDMSEVTTWSRGFDCEVVVDTPVATVKFSNPHYDFGEIWAYRPVSGSPGNWTFEGTKLVGGDSTAPMPVATCPMIAKDDSGDVFLGYETIFANPNDTALDLGLFIRPARCDSWIDFGRCTFNGDTIIESNPQFAYNAPIIGNGDSVIVGMIYMGGGDYPVDSNLYFDYRVIPYDSIRMYQGIVESNHPVMSKFEVAVVPNPFRNSIKFMTRYPISVLRIYAVTGKLVRTLTSNNQKPTTNLIWDGRNQNGCLTNPGIYFYTIVLGHNQCQGKIILTR
jgi:hypothetical protein